MIDNNVVGRTSKWASILLSSLFLLLVLSFNSEGVIQAAPPPPPEPVSDETIPPPFDEPAFEAVSLPPEAQTVSSNVTISQQTAKHPKLDSILVDLATADDVSISSVEKLVENGAIRLSDDQVHVQISIDPNQLESAVAVVVEAGGEVTKVSADKTLMQGWLPIDALESITAYSYIYYVRPPLTPILEEPLNVGSSTTEAIDDINATAWHAAGYRGDGVKIAIVDAGFTGYAGLLGTDLPASVTVKNFVDGETDADVGSSSPHGTACAEIVHDMAPDAQLYLVKIGTGLDLEEAVNWLINQKVDIISTSLGWYNVTPGDGTGFFANLVTKARNAGILWVTAASNDREAHWGGLYSDPNSNAIHNFTPTQEVNYFGPGNGNVYLIPSGYLINVYLRWNDWTNVDQDYDLLILRWNGSSWDYMDNSCIAFHGIDVQDGGAGQTPTEWAVGVTCGSTTAYGFFIGRYDSSKTVNFELFAPKVARLDEILHARSLGNLADAPNAITVAALDSSSPYPQEDYSSEGPTNGPGGSATGGFIKPDIAAYANVSTESYGTGIFNGTSAATPHVAGAAGLILDARPAFTPAQIQNLLQTRAIDMGSTGKDTRFGYGRLYLGVPLPEIIVDSFRVYLPFIIK
ncbi:MAG TPA: S8 family serine peptidase [Anaerolineae bacterium]|nr:S8 family serine peptidase [Anaerolineae bacterium]